MTEHRIPDEKEKQPGEERKQKKAYEKPAFRHERVFETTALVCGKIVGQGQCNFVRKTS
jgi:hypothetical protein